jgi:hypothetical protein
MSILEAKANAFLTLVAVGKCREKRTEVRAKVRQSKFAANEAREHALKVVAEEGADRAVTECAIAWDAHQDVLGAEHDNHISRQQVHEAASEHIRAIETLEDLHAAAQ